MNIKLLTPRLVIKKIEDKDKNKLILELGNWEVSKWLSRVNYPYSEEDADDWFYIVSQSNFNLNVFRNNSLIGGIGLTQNKEKFYELGFWIAENYWGNGYASEAVRALLVFTNKQLGMNKIEASHMYENTQSRYVLQKNGFKKQKGKGNLYSASRKKNITTTKYILIRI